MDLFLRTHRVTGETMQGTWDEVCDYDVRHWTRAVPAESVPETPERLCRVMYVGVTFDGQEEEFKGG